MNTLKKIWKTKIRILLPKPVKRGLTKVHRFFAPDKIYSTTNRDEFTAKMLQIANNQQFTNPPAHTHNNLSPAQIWWGKQKDWQVKDVTPLRYEQLVKYMKEKFIPYLHLNYTVCDLACACGDFSFHIADKVKQVDAFDLAEGMINTARNIAQRKNIGNIVFKQADILQTVLPTERYDAFMMLGLLTCIDDPDINSVIKNVHNAMKVNAKLIVKDSLTFEKSTVYAYNYNTCYSAYYHTEKTYIDFYENNGFKLIDSIHLKEGEGVSFAGIFNRI
jgi:ubiquinone/menaquinone biosynthesis C-methylase UbiE